MKKIGFFFATLVLALMLSGCSNTGVGQQIESKGNTVNNRSSLGQIVESYYKNYEPYNKGKTHIFAQKVFMDGTLVLTEKTMDRGNHIRICFSWMKTRKLLRKHKDRRH